MLCFLTFWSRGWGLAMLVVAILRHGPGHVDGGQAAILKAGSELCAIGLHPFCLAFTHCAQGESVVHETITLSVCALLDQC